jgi:6-pyruvoyltetrahydropterin/6-carboxytetrahydropterin synthase
MCTPFQDFHHTECISHPLTSDGARTVLIVHRIGLTHSFDAAHRVVGHQGGKGKCARLHGHTYTVDLSIEAPELDVTGFVVDFGELKDEINRWDHRTLLWADDPIADALECNGWGESLVRLSFNPTAENMAAWLARKLYTLTDQKEARVTVTVRETAKSAATASYPATSGCACA